VAGKDGVTLMLRTISIGSTLQVQGVPVGHTPDGRLMVRDGSRIFAGQPVPSCIEALAADRLRAPLRDREVVDAS
jgi:hypothetical protein